MEASFFHLSTYFSLILNQIPEIVAFVSVSANWPQLRDNLDKSFFREFIVFALFSLLCSNQITQERIKTNFEFLSSLWLISNILIIWYGDKLKIVFSYKIFKRNYVLFRLIREQQWIFLKELHFKFSDFYNPRSFYRFSFSDANIIKFLDANDKND